MALHQIIGAVVIAYMVIAILIALLSSKLVKKHKALIGILIFVAILLIPVWDIAPGEYYFDRLCKKDSGLRVYKIVEGVDSVYLESLGLPETFLKGYGYKFVETDGGKNILYKRHFLNQEGEILEEIIKKPVSKYMITKRQKSMWFNINRFDDLVIDRETEEVLAVNRKYGYLGGWLEKAINRHFDGTGNYCPEPRVDITDFFRASLKTDKIIREDMK